MSFHPDKLRREIDGLLDEMEARISQLEDELYNAHGTIDNLTEGRDAAQEQLNEMKELLAAAEEDGG